MGGGTGGINPTAAIASGRSQSGVARPADCMSRVHWFCEAVTCSPQCAYGWALDDETAV